MSTGTAGACTRIRQTEHSTNISQCFPHIDFTWDIRPSTFGDTFLFLLLLLSSPYTFFIPPRKWNHQQSINYWKISPRSTCFVRLVLYARELSDTPTDNLQCFPYVHLFVVSCLNRPLPSGVTTERAWLSTIFSNFQTIWQIFFHNRYILTTLANFLKNLSFPSFGRCLRYCPGLRARALCSSVFLSLRLLWAVSGRETALSAGRKAADSSINNL